MTEQRNKKNNNNNSNYCVIFMFGLCKGVSLLQVMAENGNMVRE
jgi:hypothetical protein